MNVQRILEFAKTRLLTLGLSSITNEVIALPNITFDPASKPIWVSISVNSGGNLTYTESTDLRVVILNHVINVPSNSDTGRVNNIASKIAGLYNLRNGNFEFALSQKEHLVISDVEQLDGSVFEKYYSTNVRVTFEFYEEE